MTIKDVIVDAIINEEKAYYFYKHLESKSNLESSKILFNTLAQEEMKHKKILQNLDKSLLHFDTKEKDLKILKKLMLTPFNEIGKLIDDLKTAISKEGESNKIYKIFSKNAKELSIKYLFSKLADEELKHKTMLENELNRIK